MGPDGDLYVATGDNTDPFEQSGFTPIDQREGRRALDAQATSANTNDLRGKVLRITPQDDGTYSVPDGNLFARAAGHPAGDLRHGIPQPLPNHRRPRDQRGHHRGLRPRRANGGSPSRPGGHGRVHPHGRAGQPRLAVLPRRQPALHRLRLRHRGVRRVVQLRQPGERFTEQHGPSELPQAQKPQIVYGYGVSEEFPELGSGGAAPMADPVYRFDPELDVKTKFPEEFDGHWFVSEYSRNYYKVLSLDEPKGEVSPSTRSSRARLRLPVRGRVRTRRLALHHRLRPWPWRRPWKHQHRRRHLPDRLRRGRPPTGGAISADVDSGPEPLVVNF